MTEAEVRVMWPHAKECRRPLVLDKASTRFSPTGSRRNTALLTVWFQPHRVYFTVLTSRTVRLEFCVVLSH